VGGEISDVRRFTGQVRDRLGNPFPGDWLVALYTRDPADELPAADTVAVLAPGRDLGDWFVAGPASSNVHFFRTEDTGQLIVDVTVTGAGNRQMVASVVGRSLDTATYVWIAGGGDSGGGNLDFTDFENSHHAATVA